MTAVNIFALILALIAALVAGRVLFRLFFEDGAEFRECVRCSFTPDLLSLFRGEWLEDMAKSFKLSLYISLTGIAGAITYVGVASVLG